MHFLYGRECDFKCEECKNSGRYFVCVLTFELEFGGGGGGGGCGMVGEYSRPVKPPSNGHFGQ